MQQAQMSCHKRETHGYSWHNHTLQLNALLQVPSEAVQALGRVPQLLSLCFFDCSLGDQGAQALTQAFAAGGYASLQELDVACCDIGIEGLCTLFEALGALPDAALKVERNSMAYSLAFTFLSPLPRTDRMHFVFSGSIGSIGNCRQASAQFQRGHPAPGVLLQVLVVGGNPGVADAKFEGVTSTLARAAPVLEVVWKAGAGGPGN